MATSSPFSNPISTNHQLMMKIAHMFHNSQLSSNAHNGISLSKGSFDLLYIVAPVCASVVLILLCILISLFFRCFNFKKFDLCCSNQIEMKFEFLLNVK